MAVRSREDAASLRSLARSMYFSNEAIDALLASATAAEARCVSDFISSELAIRARNKRERLYRRAQFPQPKSVEGYDFSQVSFPEGYGPSDLMSLAFVERAEDFVFLGPTGRGKTHLAIAVGAACVNAGRAVRFFTTAQLVLLLTRASRSGDLERLMAEIARCDLLVLDEFGYVPIDVEGARLLFQVMSDCYERRSMILTTNIEFSKWGVVLGDDKLASALIDRIVHHGRLVEFGGASRRMEDALMLGKGGAEMLPESPFEAAARKAGERGTCPVWQLEDFYTDHWDFETLCSGFGCVECVAEPEDLGPTEPWTPGADPSSDDIPF